MTTPCEKDQPIEEVGEKLTNNSNGQLSNKLIASTMESVITSVKRQHKNKRKKLSKKDESDISNISNILSSSLSFISPNQSKVEKNLSPLKDTDSDRKSRKKKKTKSTFNNNTVNDSNHHSKENEPEVDDTSSDQTAVPASTKKNAFEVMMNARNKIIGSNSPGKELYEEINVRNSTEKAKKKLILEEWAQRKGGQKRKLEEEEIDEYVQHQMNKRAKRLKKLISNGKKRNSKKSIIGDESIDESKDRMNKTPNKVNGKIKKDTKKINLKQKANSPHPDNVIEIVEEVYTDKVTIKEKMTSRKSIDNKEEELFLSILSSPIKQRDSLFGYFSKIEKSDTEKTPTSKESTPKSVSAKKLEKKQSISKRKSPKKRARSMKKDQQSSFLENEKEQTPPPTPTTSGRPRRECRNKTILYISDNEISPVKIAAKKLLKRAKRQLSESPEKRSPNTKQSTSMAIVPKKLAPIFVKVFPKPIVHPEILKARQQFLMSGIPECMKIEIEKQRAFEECFEQEIEFFPSISHITQTDDHSQLNESKTYEIRFRQSDNFEDLSPKKLFFNSKIEIPLKKPHLKDNECLSLVRSKEFIKLKKESSDSKFLFFRCFKQFSKKCSISQCKNGNAMFTEKYKPLNSDEFMVNKKPVTQLKELIVSWQEMESKNRRSSYDSNDDFEMGNSSSCVLSSRKAVVLIGPHGCGKTAAVYALANELNCKVLEINAGDIRTGKNILKKLQEATQSHQVSNNSSVESELSNYQGFTLILIEDADIYFEQDNGFVDAIQQLVAISKRPVIMSANQGNCAHLIRFVNQNAIKFPSANVETVGLWLSTLSITEKCYIHESDCEKLYIHNNMDLRRTLLHFQFFIQSGGDVRADVKQRVSDKQMTEKEKNFNDILENGSIYTHTRLIDFYTMNQNDPINNVKYPLQIEQHQKQTVKTLKNDRSKDNTEKKKLKEIFKVNESYAVIDALVGDCGKSDLISNLNREIAQELHNLITKILPDDSNDDLSLICENSRKMLSNDVTNETRCRSINIEIEPILRTICRSEKIRMQNDRRSSRFYHYLRDSSNANSFGIEYFDRQCFIFQEPKE